MIHPNLSFHTSDVEMLFHGPSGSARKAFLQELKQYLLLKRFLGLHDILQGEKDCSSGFRRRKTPKGS